MFAVTIATLMAVASASNNHGSIYFTDHTGSSCSGSASQTTGKIMKSCITKGAWGNDGVWIPMGSDKLISCTDKDHTSYHYKDSPSCQGSYTIDVTTEYACTGGTTSYVCSANPDPWTDLDYSDYLSVTK